MLVHHDIDIMIYDNEFNLNLVRQFCDNQLQHRIYSKWYTLTELYKLLQMLGFSLKYRYNEDNKTVDIIVSHWYGYEDDIPSVTSLVDSFERVQ